MELVHRDDFTDAGSTTRATGGAMALFVYELPTESSAGQRNRGIQRGGLLELRPGDAVSAVGLPNRGKNGGVGAG